LLVEIKYRFILLLFLLVSFTNTFAQDADEGFLNTTVKVYNINKEKLETITIIYTDLSTNQVLKTATVGGSAFFRLKLNSKYLVIVSGYGYYTKTIEINTDVKRIGNYPAFYTEIEITLFENCENNSAKANILEYPIGRILYNNSKTKFEYDFAYTSEMTELYNERYQERCKKAEKEIAEQTTKAEPKEPEKTKSEPVVKETPKKEPAPTKVAEQKINDQNAQTENKNETEKVIESVKIANQILSEDEPLPDVQPNQSIVTKEYEKKEAPVTIIRNPIFDQSRPFIYLQPKNSWPSELRSHLLDPAYKARAIGTFAYTENETKKEFFIEDVPELREKFPKQFDIAFKNWDYLVELYTNYQKN